MAKKQTGKTAHKGTQPSAQAKSRSAAKHARPAARGKAAAGKGASAPAKKPKKGVKVGKSDAGKTGAGKPEAAAERAKVLSSVVVYQGPLFRVLHDSIVEPTGLRSEREVIRHNGSVVILAVDRSGSKKNPWIVMERQYRHAANQFLWELPAGKLEAGEEPVEGAKRELAEETGYQARKWRSLVTYYASPGFLGEAMLVFLAEDLYAGEARPEADERIELRLVRLSEVLKMIEKGAIHDGKTLNAVLLYAWQLGRKRKK